MALPEHAATRLAPAPLQNGWLRPLTAPPASTGAAAALAPARPDAWQAVQGGRAGEPVGGGAWCRAGAWGAAFALSAMATRARHRFRRRSRGNGCRTPLQRPAVPLAELLPEEVAASWPEMTMPVPELEVVAADLGDLDRCVALVSEVFSVQAGDSDVGRGLAGRLGGRRSVIGAAAARPRPRLQRPIPRGSAERPDLGVVLALRDAATADDDEAPFAGLVDLSLWPSDGRVRAPGASSKPGLASRPYVLNLCVAPTYLRKGLGRALMALSERIVSNVWGDDEFYLHVEDDKVPANALYEAMGYIAQDYTYDPDCPYTKAEAKLLSTITWRCKQLTVPAKLVELPEEPTPSAEFVEDVDGEDSEEGDELADQEEEEEAEEEDEEEEEDFSWVSALKK